LDVEDEDAVVEEDEEGNATEAELLGRIVAGATEGTTALLLAVLNL